MTAEHKYYLSQCSGQDRAGMTSSWGRTPSFGAQTPMVGSMTPSYSMTPMHGAGGRTPMYGSQTPMHDGERVVNSRCVSTVKLTPTYAH